MKKKLQFLRQLFAFSALLWASALQAQTWNAPTLTGSTIATGTTYYLYNVGSNGFLTPGAQWGAMANVSALPRLNVSTTFVKWTATNTTGSIYTFQKNTGSLVANNFLFIPAATSDGSIYTDNTANNTWTVALTDAVNKVYSIQSVYSPASGYLGSAAATETTNKGIANPVRYNRAASSYTQWKFVTQADYDLYNARVVLDRYMRYARTKGGIDLTTYITDYNAGVTATINTDATNLLAALSRTDVTSSITNPSFETNSFSGWTNSGSFATQSNTPGQGWTKSGTYYAEKFTTSGTYLGTGALTQSVALTNGLYGMVVSGHAVQQAGANPLHTGAFITAGSKSTEVSAGQDYYIDSISVTTGSLTIGYALQATVQANWIGFDNFRLYRYVTYSTPSLAASVTAVRYDNVTNSSSFTIVGANLTSAITITTPTGVTLSGTNVTGGSGTYTIASGNANATNTVTATYDGTTAVNGSISISGSGSQAVSTSVTVVGSSNASCYTAAYSQGNMIADPTLSAVDLTTGGFTGWGTRTITNANPYCGRGSAYVIGANSGSIDRTLSTGNGNALVPNTLYRLRAMINSKASAGKYFQFEIEGYNGTASLHYNLSNTSGWSQFDQTFTTGATVTTGKGIYFNSFSGSQPLIGDTCFIDNYELYPVPKTYTSSTALTFLTSGVTKKVAVRASNLTSDITITAPTGFTLSTSSMLKTVSGSASDSLSITFNDATSRSGYVYLVSGSVRDSIQVTGTVAPTIAASKTAIALDNLFKSSDTFTVDGANLTSDISISAPAGITVSPTTIPMSAALNVTVTVSYDKSASVSGNVSLTSGSATTNVALTGTKLTFTDPGTSELKHLYTFEDGTANDEVFANKVNGTLNGGASVSGGKLQLAANGDFVALPGLALNGYSAVSQEIWFTSTGVNTGFHGLTFFGNTSGGLGYNYLLMAPARGDNFNRFCITSGTYNSEVGVNSPEIEDTNLHQLVTIARGDSLIMYIDGVNQGSVLNTIALSTLGTTLAYIGKTGYTADPSWTGSVSKYTIYNKPLSVNEVYYLFDKGANYTPTITGLGADSTSLHFTTSTFEKTFNVIAAGLSGDLTLTVPTGITVSGVNVTGSAPTYTIANASANGTNSVTFTWSKAANIASGTITLSSTGATDVTISVNTSDVQTSTIASVALGTGGVLSPAFASGTTTYTIKAPADVASVTVTGTATSASESIGNNGNAVSNGNPVTLIGTSYSGLSTTDYTFNWGGNYTFTDWAAEGSTDAALSIPTVYGWSATPTLGWAAANAAVAGTTRYFDFVDGVNGANPLYTYNGSNYSGRLLMTRWDGGNQTRVFSYPVYIASGQAYQITGKAAWNSNGSAPTITFSVNSAKDNTGTSYGSGSVATTTAGALKDIAVTHVSVPTSGVYYLTITSTTQAMCGIGDLVLSAMPTGLSTVEGSVSILNANTSEVANQTLTLLGANLTGNVSLAITGANASLFGVSPTTITPVDGQVGATTVTISYSPLIINVDFDVATLTISSTGATDLTFNLQGQCLATGIKSEINAVNAYAVKRNLVVTGANSYAVYNVQGTKVAEIAVNTANTIVALAPGIYFVKAGSKVQKVMVK